MMAKAGRAALNEASRVARARMQSAERCVRAAQRVLDRTVSTGALDTDALDFARSEMDVALIELRDALEARRQITERWGAIAIEYEQPVDADDVRAGLPLVPAARGMLVEAELDLINHGRAKGLTWGEIGALLGIGDRRAAQLRHARLQARRGSSD